VEEDGNAMAVPRLKPGSGLAETSQSHGKGMAKACGSPFVGMELALAKNVTVGDS